MRWVLAIIFATSLGTILLAKEREICLRALILCDSATPTVKTVSYADALRMKKSLENIAYQLKLCPRIRTLVGKNLFFENVKKWVRSIPRSSRDVVFVYYSGYGDIFLYS